ncbi:hypothetical protein CR513_13963, partial [Mucuna pruriens]
MDSETNIFQAILPVFNGENYDLWAIKMEASLEDLDLWKLQIKKNKIDKDKDMFICWCLSNHLPKNHNSQINESNLGLFEGQIH